MESFTDPVGLGVPRLGARMVDVLHGKVQFVPVALRRPTGLCAAGGEDPVQRNLVTFEEKNSRTRSLSKFAAVIRVFRS